MLRNGARGHFRLDTNAPQKARNGSADGLVIHIAVIGRVQCDGEAIGIASLLEQLLGLVDVSLVVGRHALVIAVDKGRGHHTRGVGQTSHHRTLDGIAVNRQFNGFAHLGVGQRVLALDVAGLELCRAHVQAQEDGAVFRPFVDAQLAVLLQARHVLRGNVLGKVHFTRQQCSHACGG